jgi:putative MATE family efflux protein
MQKSKDNDSSVLATLVRFSLPIVFVSVLQSGYQLTDAFWVGRLGENAVAAVSMSFPFIFFLTALGLGLAIAGSTLIAQYVGARQPRMVNHVAAQTVLVFVVVSIILTVAGYAVAPHLLSFMGADAAVFNDAVAFMRISALGVGFLLGFIMFQSTMRGIGRPMPALVIVAVTVLLNFALDPLFIYGYGSLPGYGVVGAGIATFLTQGISAVAGLALLFSGRYGIRLERADFRPDFGLLRKMFRLGVPASVEQSSRAIGFGLMTSLVAGFGTQAVAAYGVSTNLLQFVIIPAVSLSMATATLAGQSIGAGDIPRAEKIGRASAFVAMAALSLAGITLFLFAPFFVSFFLSADPATEQVAVDFVRILSASFPFIGLQMACFGVLRGAGSATATMVLTILQYVILFPLAYFLAHHTSYGIEGVWWAFPVTNIVSALVTAAWYLQGGWKKHRLTEDERLSEHVTEEVIIEESQKAG